MTQLTIPNSILEEQWFTYLTYLLATEKNTRLKIVYV